MFQTIQLPAFLNFRPSLALRSILLFAIAYFSVIALPLVTDCVLQANGSSVNAAMPVQSVTPTPVSTIAASSFPVAMTHQEPNFYQ
jgi:hypothetical protein